MMKNLLILFLVFFLISCTENGQECFTPPEGASFKLVDAETGENLITNGTLDAKKFSVKDEEGNSAEFKVITENNLNAVAVTVGWYNGTKNYHFDLGNSQSFDFKVKSHEISGDCGGYIVDQIDIVNVPYEMESYFFLIKL